MASGCDKQDGSIHSIKKADDESHLPQVTTLSFRLPNLCKQDNVVNCLDDNKGTDVSFFSFFLKARFKGNSTKLLGALLNIPEILSNRPFLLSIYCGTPQPLIGILQVNSGFFLMASGMEKFSELSLTARSGP
jgi:hypothetical protein